MQNRFQTVNRISKNHIATFDFAPLLLTRTLIRSIMCEGAYGDTATLSSHSILIDRYLKMQVSV